MRVSATLARTSTGAVLATILTAGCAGTASQVTPNAASPVVAPAAATRSHLGTNAVASSSFMDGAATGKPLVFVSNLDGETVNIYLQSGKNKHIGQIAGLAQPFDLSTDKAGNLYVANEESPYLQIYAPPYNGTPTTLDDDNYAPAQVGIAPDGTIAIANYCLEPSCSGGTSSVAFFEPNSTSPCAVVPAAAAVNYLYFGSFDRHGNFFTDGVTSGKTTILGEISGECKANKMSTITVANRAGILGGVHVNKKDQIVILDTAPSGDNPPVLYTYNHPVNGDLGEPITTEVLQGANHTNEPGDFAFQGSGKNVFVPDYTDGKTNEYAYPAGGAIERTIDAPQGIHVAGIAVTPPLAP